MESLREERRENPLCSAVQLIPGLDEGSGETRIWDRTYYDDEELIKKMRLRYAPQASEWGFIQTSYGSTLFRSFSRFPVEEQSFLRSIFSKTVLVDIGSGNGSGRRIANLLNSKGYIAVDPHDLRSQRKVSFYPNCAFVAEDALTFLRRVPNDSISMLVSSVDGYVIQDGKMRSAIIQEMKRTLSSDGGILSWNSDLYVGGETFSSQSLRFGVSLITKNSTI